MTAAKQVLKPHSSGLEGIIVGETRLSLVDGEKGQLIIGGFDIEQVAGEMSFEQICDRLWSEDDAYPMHTDLGMARLQVFEQLQHLRLPLQEGMDYIRSALSVLSLPDNPVQQNIFVTASVAVAVALWYRQVTHQPFIEPDPALSHSTDFLRMIFGVEPSPAKAQALESYLVTVSDHGMNASTFAARVVASTASDLLSAVVAGIGALKGPLHGGAPGPVLDMFDAIGHPSHARAWLETELLAGRRIMGMGHRIYRVRDPRAAVLEKAIRRLELQGVTTSRLSMARSVEEAAALLLQERYPDRPLKANVEFYTAVLLDAVGLPRELFSPTFAVGRVIGWCAHVREQRLYGRLIRPDSKYIGVMP